MTRPRILPCAVLLGAFACADEPNDAASPIRNVVLVSIDTLRADRLGAYGFERGASPYLDHLAENGVVFEQAIAQAPWTAPSHASMLTSLHPSVLGIGPFNDPGRFSDEAVTLAEVFHAAGRATGATVAGGFVAAALGFDQGFDVYDESGWDIGRTVDTATQWLDGIGDRPFFLFVHTLDVHKYNPPGAQRAKFVRPYDGPLKDQPHLAEQVQGLAYAEQMAALGPADRAYVRDLYVASLAAVDEGLRRLHGALAQRGLLDDTLIVVTSDHGEEFWEHGRTGHGYTLHDENLRVPLILHHPSLAPRRIKEQVRLLDLAPTIVGLCGLEAPASWQGVDLRPLMEGRPLRLVAFSERAHFPLKSVRTPEHKYVMGLLPPREALFDLAADPAEQQDVAPRKKDVLAQMRVALRDRVRANLRASEGYARGTAALSDSTAEQLRQLGYLGGTDGASGGPEDKTGLGAWLECLESTP